jgi:hypothetical protein
MSFRGDSRGILYPQMVVIKRFLPLVEMTLRAKIIIMTQSQKPESSFSNRSWTPAFAGVTNFGAFYESINLNILKLMAGSP